MADNVVSFLLENLTQLLSQELKLLGGVEDQVRSLQNELSLINAFLKNTDGKRHDNELVKEVVSQIRNVAYEAEDVIDTFIMAVTKHRRKGKLGKLIHSCNRAISFHEVANKVESIKIINKNIHDNRNKYGIEIAESSGGETEAEVKLHKRRRYVEEDHVVGFGHDTEALVKQLIEESAEEKFLEVCSDVKLSPMSKCRRISIHFANHPYISSNPCESSNNRSVIGFQGVVGLESPLDKGYYLKWLCKSNKLVRVVELSNMAICCAIPKKIQNLFLLRYLSISSGLRRVIIPNSLCNLWNLETLDMRNSKIESLPKGLWKLQKLRHLYLNGPTSLPGTDNEEGLPNLQVLTGIALNHYTESLFAKARFPNLRKLGLCSSSVQESRLLILSLSSIHPLRHLQTLKVCKYIYKLSNPSSLQLIPTKLTLLDMPNFSPSFGVLCSLTNIRILKVVGCDNFVLECDESSFCQLRVFKMAKLNHMRWTMKKGAMPRLQRLVIERCNFYMMPLDELWCSSALQDVEVFYPDPKLVKGLQQFQMRDGCRLQVNPSLDPFPTTN
ncbi:hypothetical protein CMV_013181 [Castanea mollissima]|uniref:Rx N-terminal domain-containing protein n=1 Tax=Castanea mollissima TaxID=60419 RepID=A0A8J4VM84_9ROSI|nr:hypothetical protein CMV_013181 [Castanea mollissima]